VRTYEWADLRLTTDFELAELPAGDSGGSTEEWRVRRGDGRPPLCPPRRWFHRWRQPDGRRWLSFARHAEGYLLRFRGLADFDVRPRVRQIDGYRPSTTPDHTFNHLLLDQVLPLVGGSAHRLMLHASVVEVDGRAVAFLGATRHGKSTLAAALARRGHTVLSDDCCVVCESAAGLAVAPTYPGLRLFPEDIDGIFGTSRTGLTPVAHYSPKRRIVLEPVATRIALPRVPLGAFYVIAPQAPEAVGGAVHISERHGRDGVLDIVGVTFYLDVESAERAREGFALAADAASVCPVRLLSLPWDLGALDSVADAIVSDRRR
jgi:hypothetical protein